MVAHRRVSLLGLLLHCSPRLRVVVGTPDTREGPMNAASAECWSGVTVDHLYEDCPNRRRGEATMRRWGLWFKCVGEVDPHGTDLCGLCVHRYDRSAHPIEGEDQ